MQTGLMPDAALQIVLEQTNSLDSEFVAHEFALNRVLARDVVSSANLPPFTNSAMDGFAVVAADLERVPTTLKRLETIGAGEIASSRVERGFCLPIMTGAPLPEGADSVVMREETRVEKGSEDEIEQICFLESAKIGQNIRRAGDDVKLGEVVLKAGTQINAASWAMLASLGESQTEVFRRPRVGIVATGKELVDVDANLEAGQIRDSNSFALRALCESAGAQIVAVKRTGDTIEEVESALREFAPDCDLLITSGGVSAGDFDPVRDVLLEKADVFFWKVNMKPGKPVMFAEFAETPIFGLPGNPVSVMVTWEILVRPALLKMGGQTEFARAEVAVELEENFKRSAGRWEFVRAHVRAQNGRLKARITGDQSSGRISNTLGANALLVVHPETRSLCAGDTLLARMLDW